MKKGNLIKRVAMFYVEGFREMTLGRTLWILILIKLFIMFAILKLFFFPNLLSGYSEQEKADKIIDNLTIIE